MKIKSLKNQLKKLVTIPAVSSFEEQRRAYILTQLTGKFAVVVDVKGNLIVQKGKKPEKLALIVHMDGKGFLVIGKTKEYLAVIPTRVRSDIPVGLVTHVKATDLLGNNHKGKLFYDPSLAIHPYRVYIDTTQNFEVGSPIVYTSQFQQSGDSIISANLDNAMGLAVAIAVFNCIEEGTVIFTAVEEIGFHGAGPAVYQVKPEKAIVLDTTYDSEKALGARLYVEKGPSICIKDAVFGNKKMIQELRQIATTHKIPYQLELWQTANSDMLAIHDKLAGIASVFIGLPIQNPATNKEKGSLLDMHEAVKLLTAYFHFIYES